MEPVNTHKFIKHKVHSKKHFENEIFISRKRKNLEKFYYERAYDLIHTKNYREIFICGLGSCLNLAVKVSLIVIDSIPLYKIDSVETSSVKQMDDFVDLETNDTIRKEDRMSNLIRIKIVKK